MKENKNYALYLIIFLLIVFYLTVTSQNQPDVKLNPLSNQMTDTLNEDNDIMELVLNDPKSTSDFYGKSGDVLEDPLTLEQVMEKFDSKMNINSKETLLNKKNLGAKEKSGSMVDYTDLTRLKLKKCEEKKFSVSFLCHENWNTEHLENAVVIIISEDPVVTLTVTKLDLNVAFLGQLTRNYFVKKGLYNDGFKLNRRQFAGYDAVEVSAFSSKSADRRVLDYFFKRDSELYAVMFAVGSKENWDQYKFLIKKIADSMQFSDEEKIGKLKK